ncbi:putative serine protease PepD [Thermocatellispora tengchongensis]|uniref:Putative serine protease PepD n=2 Tax=Thermocatellispora tengchongensis TaxID=1073253 RepID=A0A840P0U4_9ACTN|nr:trypsin-like peptidase domain-containing protein [Thermocatellispora tengchongensis]MBB5133002.1 putative serine protease PepD [Thermocatellispora tengchongensis]
MVNTTNHRTAYDDDAAARGGALGLGRPRGPDFLPGASAPPAAPPPGAGVGPAPAAPVAAPRRGRVLLTAALVAAVVGGGAGVAGARLGAEPQRAAPVALPRSTAGPVTVPGGLSGIAAQVLPSVVSVETGGGNGSGFVIDATGHILTNAHVVDGRTQVSVVFDDGRRASAEVVGSDETNDLAVLAVRDATALTPAVLGRSADVAVGDQVLAIGSPLGLQGTVTSGIVSAVDREVPFGGSGAGLTALQTDASINPGNSGGPLVNARGEVIGVNTAILSRRGGGSIGIGFAIPIDRAADVAERIIRN